MTVYLLRHAIAEDRSASGLDRDRALAPEGVERLGNVLRVAAKAGMRPSLVLSSPYVRARQTAEQAHHFLFCKQPVVLSDAFTPNGSPRKAWEEIRTFETEEPLLVVSHDPLISGLFSYLLGVSEFIHSFKKAGLAKLDFTRTGAKPSAEIQWILTPSLAEAIASRKD